MNAKVLEAFATMVLSFSGSVVTLASTNTSLFPARKTSARQNSADPEAGRRKETLFSTVITS
jgi:hypothetical protein